MSLMHLLFKTILSQRVSNSRHQVFDLFNVFRRHLTATCTGDENPAPDTFMNELASRYLPGDLCDSFSLAFQTAFLFPLID